MTDPVSPTTFRSPNELLGAVPYLLGYHPCDEIVAIYLGADQQILRITAEPLHSNAETLTEHLAVRAPDHCVAVALVGYGLPTRATLSAIGRILDLFLPLHALLLVIGNRCFCLVQDCTCPASSGMDVDPANIQVATQLAAAGMVALPSRQALQTLVAPDLIAQADMEIALAAQPQTVAVAGVLADVLTQAKRGHRLSTAELAPFAVALANRDAQLAAWHAVWACMWQRDLWLDVTRRVPDRYVTGPATLAAWCAWRRGEHALAAVALEQATHGGPGDRLTRLVTSVVRTHLPAERLRRPAAH